MATPPSTGGSGNGDEGGSSSEAVPKGVKYQNRATGNAAKNYDFVSAREPNRKTTNVTESIGQLIKSCLSGGVVAIHESYKNCGLWTALMLNVFLGLAVGYCMHMLAKSAQVMYVRVQLPEMTYSDLAEACLATGPWEKMKKHAKLFRYLVDVMIIINYFGSCCVYQVVVARSLKQILDGTEKYEDSGQPPIRVFVLALLVPCILLCISTTLKYLAPFSNVADMFIFMVAVATVYYAIKTADQSPLDMPVFKSIPGMFEFIGVCVFSVEGIGATLAIENNMTNPNKIGLVIFGGMSFVVGMVAVVGFFGYWSFGEESQSPITVNFPWVPFPVMLKVFMALIVFVTFGLHFWLLFEMIWHYLKGHFNPEMLWVWERVYRVLFVIIITALAVTFPNVSNFIGLIGSFCLTNIGFVFPAFIELMMQWKDPGLGYLCWRLWKAVFIILFGASVCVVGTYFNSKELYYQVFVKKPTALYR